MVEKYINNHPVGCEAQLTCKCLFKPTFWWAILIRKVGQTDLVLACYQGSLAGLCMQDYKSLCVAAVTNCFTLVNIQTHIDTDSI